MRLFYFLKKFKKLKKICSLFRYIVWKTLREVEKINAKDNLIRLVNEYQNLIFSICLKLTKDYFVAEDLTQDTFLTAYQHLEEFDGKAEKAWLCRIASNKCIDYQKAAARRMIATAEEEIPELASSMDNEPLQTVLNKEVMKELENCLELLSSPYREVAKQYFIDGKTAKEISEYTGIGIKTIQTRIYRAKEQLKKSFGKGN